MDQIILNSTNYQGCFMTHNRYSVKNVRWKVPTSRLVFWKRANWKSSPVPKCFQNYLSSILQIWILCRLQNLIQKVCHFWLKISEIDFSRGPPHITIPPTDTAEHFTSPKKNPICNEYWSFPYCLGVARCGSKTAQMFPCPHGHTPSPRTSDPNEPR